MATKRVPVKKTAPKAPAKKAPVKKAAPSKKGVVKKSPPKKSNGNGHAKVVQEAVTKQDLEAFQAQVAETLATFEKRLSAVEAFVTGYGSATVSPEDGVVEVGLDSASYEELRNLAYQLGYDEDTYNLDEDDLREGLIAVMEENPDVVFEREGEAPPLPKKAPAKKKKAAPKPAPEPEPEVEEDEDEEITEEAIQAMNWTQLCGLADRIELDYSDINKRQPKVLRNRIIEALSGDEGEDEEEGAELEEGDAIIVTHEGETYPAVFLGVDDDGDVVVRWDADGEEAAVPAEFVSVP